MVSFLGTEVFSGQWQRTTDIGHSAIRNPHSAIKKMGPHRACRPGWSAYAITRETWVDRSPRENPPPSVGDASADVDRRSKSQARHFSPRPANGSIVMIGGKISTTIFGHPAALPRNARRQGKRSHAEAQRRGGRRSGDRGATEHCRQ